MQHPKTLSTTILLVLALAVSGCGDQDQQSADSSIVQEAAQDPGQGTDMEESVAEYIKKFPHQDTYNYAMQYTGGEAAKFNVWTLGAEPELVKAGEDKVVRMNNDTYYKMAFFLLDQGPVTLEASSPSEDRFASFQYMDDHNVNFKNVINPNGKYTLYYGD